MIPQLFLVLQTFKNYNKQQYQFKPKTKISQFEHYNKPQHHFKSTAITQRVLSPSQFNCIFCNSSNHKFFFCNQCVNSYTRQQCTKCLQLDSPNNDCDKTCTACKGQHHKIICKSKNHSNANSTQRYPLNSNFTPLNINHVTNIAALNQTTQTQPEIAQTTLSTNNSKSKSTLPIVYIQVKNPDT